MQVTVVADRSRRKPGASAGRATPSASPE
jgi:hypothetical protein